VTQGVTTRTWSHPRGHIDFEAVRTLVAPPSPYFVATAAIEVENTHNFAGGVVQPLEDLRALRSLADERDVRLHLDGARLWNAHVASGSPLDSYGRLFDTVSVCFSKGLGAPVGSLLAGPVEVIEQAREWRRRLGAGWRQAGLLAAAARYAVDEHLERLADDHINAKVIAETVASAAPYVVRPAEVETNIVMLDVGARAAEVVEHSRAGGLLMGLARPGVVRLTTHLDVTSSQARLAGDTLAKIIADLSR
jgi:threonine aldolase